MNLLPGFTPEIYHIKYCLQYYSVEKRLEYKQVLTI
jgi:hypothetical protein